jgi:hypothetical protein
MNPDSEAVILKDSRIISARVKVAITFVCIVLLAILGLAWYYWQGNQTISSFDLVTYGLDTVPTADSYPTGQLYFSAAPTTVDQSTIPQLFKFDFADRNIASVFTEPAYSFAFGNDEFDTAIVYLDNPADPDGYQPAWINKMNGESGPLTGVDGFREVDLTLSPDNTFYAFSYRPTDMGDMTDINQWNIAIINYTTKEKIIIENAAEPDFLNDNEGVVYMTTNGLFKYNLNTKTTVPIYTLYQNLEMYDDFDISGDATKIILTIQRLNVISVANGVADDEEFQEVGAIINVDVRYRSPVLSPDGTFFAVTAAHAIDFDEQTQLYSKIYAEIRAIGSSDVIDIVMFDDLVPASVTLESWGE